MKNNQKKQPAPQKLKSKAPESASRDNNPVPEKIFVYASLAVVLLVVCLVRYRLLNLPLERDEGEYALMGQMILRGIPPYEMAYNMKLPGTYYMYALLMSVFGQSTAGIHWGLLFVNLGSTLLLFRIGQKLVNNLVGLVAATSFALMSLSEGVLGAAAHATQFNVFFALGGLLALLQYAERPGFGRLVLSGFCFGLSFVMKQQAVFLMLFGLLAFWMLERQREPFEWKRSVLRWGVLGSAMLAPYGLVVLIAWLTGTFDKFWHWTIGYAQQYAGIKTASDAWRYLDMYFPFVTKGFWSFWMAGLLGLGALFFSQGIRKYRWLMLAFVLCSMACVVPGLYFRPHYFIVFLPALALLAGVTLNFFREILTKYGLHWLGSMSYVLLAGMLAVGISVHSNVFFKDDLGKISHTTYGLANPFQESMEIAKFIRSNTNEQDKVAIIGSEPQIYFYADRLPATGYIYTYPLMENQPYSLDMQHEMMAEVEKARPKYLLFVNLPFSWTRNEKSSNEIFDWYNEYKRNYQLVGAVELNPNGKATYTWREALAGYKPKGTDVIWVYELK